MLLLTPGPLTTADATRAALDRDFGSRDDEFTQITAEVRERLVALAGGPPLTAIPLQGSGSFVVEAMLGTLVPAQTGRLLVLVNGAYGRRMAEMARRMGRAVVTLDFAETAPVDPDALRGALVADPAITHVAVVHCETTTGLLNPVEAVARVCDEAGRRLLIDAMSSFGAIPLDVAKTGADCLVASSNKCLEGVPGVGFAIARTDALQQAVGQAPSLVLDLVEQWARFEKDGQWRFTPPVQVMAALREALRLHEAEGGVEGRNARYRRNLEILVSGLEAAGYSTLLPAHDQAPIIVTFAQPEGFDFETFYEALRREGFAIYPGKLTQTPTFRVGCIGQVFPKDMERFVAVVTRLGATT